jgi:hypothetical protein
VTLCVGADLTASKTAATSYDYSIAKSVDKTTIQNASGEATFNYTVTVTESKWTVTGKITVTNPNDWEDVVLTDLTDSVGSNGGVCTVSGLPATVSKSSSIELGYTCTYSAAPTAVSGTNTATATWDASTYYTPSGSASGTAGFSFSALTVTDVFDGTSFSLGTVAGNVASKTFTYSRTVKADRGTCSTKNNTATAALSPTDKKSASQSVTYCNTNTGALTIGFWQNRNGQGIIKAGVAPAGVCASGTWLRQYAPFQDLSSTATCAQVATYVTNVIKAANAGGASMNAMLKAQMLATALDVYFSDSALGGNQIGAPGPIGAVKIDLTSVNKPIGSSNFEDTTSSFGGTPTAQTVSQLLTYAASQSDVGGATWYGQVKSGQASQELAKDTFDAINNRVAYIVFP